MEGEWDGELSRSGFGVVYREYFLYEKWAYREPDDPVPTVDEVSEPIFSCLE